MERVREILKLNYEVKLSLREIALSCNCSKSTVGDVLERAKNAGIEWPTEMNDIQLVSMIYSSKERTSCPTEPDMEYVFSEMKKKNVTLTLLWEEYKRKFPEGLMYSQFCSRYKEFKCDNQLTMHKEHKAGEQVEVDWAGSTMKYTNPETGEIIPVYLFVSVLPASNYPFAYAFANMKSPSWLEAHVKAYEFYGGVPKITTPDNTKTAVIKSDLVDPILNKSYLEMARHYGTTLIPARAGKPKDKGADENMVGIVSRRIIAALRNVQFFGLEDINIAVAEEMQKLILKPFQKRQGNRLTAFETIDKSALQPLPATRYEFADWKETKVQFDYHVDFAGFFYSVNFAYVGKMCSIRATLKTIEIFANGLRVAVHNRNFNTFKRYTTLPEHMPESHKAVLGWNSDRLLNWAQKIGPNTSEMINNILISRDHHIQTYRTCLGIMRFSKMYSNEIMEATSQETIEMNTFSYKYFNILIKQVATKLLIKKPEITIAHDNVRGISAFAGGGINA